LDKLVSVNNKPTHFSGIKLLQSVVEGLLI